MSAPSGYRHAARAFARALRSGAGLAVLVSSLLAVGSAAAVEPAATPSLRISGSARLAGDARPLSDGFEVRGTLTDEVGRPIAGAEVLVQASSVTGLVRGCEGGAPRADRNSSLLLVSDGAGKLCAQINGQAEGSVLLRFDDQRGYYASTERRVQLAPGAGAGLELGFDPSPSTLVLDRPLHALGLVTRAPSGATMPEGAELVLSLDADGAERELARQPLLGVGETQLVQVSARSLGSPGPARLIARLRSPRGDELVQATVAVLREVTVALAFESGAGDAGTVEPGGSLKLNAASALGPATAGVVEARALGRSVAAAKVRNGQALLTLPSSASELGSSNLSIHYVGEGPGWLGGPALEAKVRPPGRSWSRYAAWFIAALLAALAVVMSWRRPARELLLPQSAPPRLRASVELLEAFRAGSGYRGTVQDAHDSEPVHPAAVSVLGAHGNVLEQVRVQSDGSFSLDPPPGGAQIEVTAPFHATLSAGLPAPGVIALFVVSRRRALLDKLVRWAERRGAPWIRTAGEPTPAHVAHAAGMEGEPNVEQWARSVEELAYGPNPPDAAREQSIGTEPKTLRERGID